MSSFNKDRAVEWVKERVRGFFASKRVLLIHYAGPDRDGWGARVNQVKAERKSLLSHGDMCQIISAVQATRTIPGDMVEFGVAYGASARIIAEYGGGRTLHLFDTFTGLPKPGANDSARFFQGSYSCGLEDVQQYLTGLPCQYYKGFFPGTAASLEATGTFSFVHLDVDLYESTLAGLKFFYPRMSRGGILISHDYQSAAGVDKAFAEFFADKPEAVVPLSGYQCLVTKL
jgi:O-methyltransferase